MKSGAKWDIWKIVTQEGVKVYYLCESHVPETSTVLKIRLSRPKYDNLYNVVFLNKNSTYMTFSDFINYNQHRLCLRRSQVTQISIMLKELYDLLQMNSIITPKNMGPKKKQHYREIKSIWNGKKYFTVLQDNWDQIGDNKYIQIRWPNCLLW